MNRLISARHNYRYLWILLCALLLAFEVGANNLPNGYMAKYEVFRNSQHVASTNLELVSQPQGWLWKMETQAIGLFSWLTRKTPFSDTFVTLDETAAKVLYTVAGDYHDQPPTRATWFDHQNRLFYNAHNNKSSQKKFKLPIYNYHSVMMLYHRLMNGESLEISYFRSGKSSKGKVQLQKAISVNVQDKNLLMDRLTLKYGKKTMYFDFDSKSFAPLQITQIKGDDVSIMLRKTFKNLDQKNS